MRQFANYFIVILLSLAILIQLLRIIKLLFDPKFLDHKAFDFPERKFTRLIYYLCTIIVALMVILLKLGVIE